MAAHRQKALKEHIPLILHCGILRRKKKGRTYGAARVIGRKHPSLQHSGKDQQVINECCNAKGNAFVRGRNKKMKIFCAPAKDAYLRDVFVTNAPIAAPCTNMVNVNTSLFFISDSRS